MNNQNNLSLFITKFRERKDRNGQTYFIGSIGLATAMIRKHKTNADEWNLFLMEPLEKSQAQQQGGFNSQPKVASQPSAGGYTAHAQEQFNEDEIPF